MCLFYPVHLTTDHWAPFSDTKSLTVLTILVNDFFLFSSKLFYFLINFHATSVSGCLNYYIKSISEIQKIDSERSFATAIFRL